MACPWPTRGNDDCPSGANASADTRFPGRSKAFPKCPTANLGRGSPCLSLASCGLQGIRERVIPAKRSASTHVLARELPRRRKRSRLDCGLMRSSYNRRSRSATGVRAFSTAAASCKPDSSMASRGSCTSVDTSAK